MELFDFVKEVTTNDDHNFLYNLDEEDKKNWSSLLVTKIVSMNIDYVDLMSFLQKYNSVLSEEQYYKLLSTFVPKKKTYFEFLKDVNSNKYNKDKLEKVAMIYECSLEKAKDYMDLLDNKQLREIFKDEGIGNKT